MRSGKKTNSETTFGGNNLAEGTETVVSLVSHSWSRELKRVQHLKLIENHEESQDEGFAKRPKNANIHQEIPKGEIRSEKVSQKEKGPERTYKVGETPSSLKGKRQQHDLNGSARKPSLHEEANKITLADAAEDIKQQLARIFGS